MVNVSLGQAEPLRNVRSTSPASTPTQPASHMNNTDKPTIDEQFTKCVSRGCVAAASKIIEYLDEDVDPCDNFYEFACGNFLKTTKIAEDKVSVDLSSTVDDLVREQLRTIISEPPQLNESKPFRLAKNFNAACLNQSIIEERGIKPLADILEAFGGWPVVKGDLWCEKNFDWVDAVKRFRRMGLETNAIFALSVVTDLKNSSKRVLDVSSSCNSSTFFGKVTKIRHIFFQLDEARLELGREYLINGMEDDAVKSYYKFMVENAIVFGANRTQAENEMREVLELEFKLANVSTNVFCIGIIYK